MKHPRTALLSVLLALLAAAPVLADEAGAETGSIWGQLAELGKVAAYFLLVMAAIGLCLFLTRKIGEKWGKH